MATAAEELLTGTGWVPEPLRTPGQVFAAVEPETEAAPEGEAESAADGGESAIASAPPAEDTEAAAIPTAALAAE
jgi:ParB family chromosome partitioning protein